MADKKKKTKPKIEPKHYWAAGIALFGLVSPLLFGLFAESQRAADQYASVLAGAKIPGIVLLFVSLAPFNFLSFFKRFVFGLSILLCIWSGIETLGILYENSRGIPESVTAAALKANPVQLPPPVTGGLSAQGMAAALTNIEALLDAGNMRLLTIDSQIDGFDLSVVLSAANANDAGHFNRSIPIFQQYAALLAARDEMAADDAQKATDAYGAFIKASSFQAVEKMQRLDLFTIASSKDAALCKDLSDNGNETLQVLRNMMSFYQANMGRIIVANNNTIFQNPEQSAQLNGFLADLQELQKKRGRAERAIALYRQKRDHEMDAWISVLASVSGK